MCVRPPTRMVAEDRSSQYPHNTKPLFSAIFDKRSGTLRYDPPTGWRLNRDTQLRLTRAFAKFLAWADHIGLVELSSHVKTPFRCAT